MPNLHHTAIAAALALGLASTVLPAEAAGNSACVRELAHSENSLVKTLVRVRGAAQARGADRCAVYQDHVAIVSKARDVFARCKSGADREADVNQLDGALSDANALIAKSCGN